MNSKGQIIDALGYRQNVGIIVTNDIRQVVWCKRYGLNVWQFPQGGIQQNETIEQALFRELKEETGLDESHVAIIASSKGWFRYRIPKNLIRTSSLPGYIGQKKRWFLLKLQVDESHIFLNHTKNPEFDNWRWVDYWYPLQKVVSFKRNVYERTLKEFEPVMFH